MKPYLLENSEYKVYKIGIWHIIIPLCIGLIITLISYPKGFFSLKMMAFVTIYSLSIGIPSMKAFEYVEWKLERITPWLKKPLLRFFVSIITEISIGIIILILINFLFFFIGKGQSITEVFRTTFTGLKYLITFSLIGIVLINCIFFFRSWRQSAINEEKLKRDKLTAEYETLKNQVNPHFLFNNLTALSSLVYKDQDKAVRFINELSNVFRYVLECRDKEITDLATERKLLESIAYLYHIRHDEGLQISLNLQETNNKYVVPMALQMLVENAIKHNMASANKPLIIEIEEDNGYIIVKNNIQPKLNTAPSTGIGLKNIQSRYQYFTGKKVIILSDNSFFIVKLPLLNKENDSSNYN